MIVLGLLVFALGSICQASSYVPINKVKDWHWESFWATQGVFAWLVFPLLGALAAVPQGESLVQMYLSHPREAGLNLLFGVLWGIGGLTFGLGLRYLGVGLGESLALGVCASLGTILTPLVTGHPSDLTTAVLVGVAVALAGILIIGWAGYKKSNETGAGAVKDFNFKKGIFVVILSGIMSACFNIGLGFGANLNWPESPEAFKNLPATLLVTLGGAITNFAYCFYQNSKNKSWGDYARKDLLLNNMLFCALAGLLWYLQYVALSLGKGLVKTSPALLTLSWCILMSMNVLFGNLWGVVLKEWKGCSRKTISILVIGLAILIISCFLPQLLS